MTKAFRLPSQQLMRFSRMVLLAYGLVIGLAVLGPWWHPPSLQVICLGNGGSKLIDADGPGTVSQDHLLACALCLPLQAPPHPALPTPPRPAVALPALAAPDSPVAALAPRWRPPAQAPPAHA